MGTALDAGEPYAYVDADTGAALDAAGADRPAGDPDSYADSDRSTGEPYAYVDADTGAAPALDAAGTDRPAGDPDAYVTGAAADEYVTGAAADAYEGTAADADAVAYPGFSGLPDMPDSYGVESPDSPDRYESEFVAVDGKRVEGEL